MYLPWYSEQLLVLLESELVSMEYKLAWLYHIVELILGRVKAKTITLVFRWFVSTHAALKSLPSSRQNVSEWNDMHKTDIIVILSKHNTSRYDIIEKIFTKHKAPIHSLAIIWSFYDFEQVIYPSCFSAFNDPYIFSIYLLNLTHIFYFFHTIFGIIIRIVYQQK